jgi:hypothetical protein
MDTNYYTWGDDTGYVYNYQVSQDWFPIPNGWRGRPLSDNPWIRANVAGYYPYPKTRKTIVPRPEPEWQYAWAYAPSTVFPSNPQFTADRTIILER